MSEPLKFTLRTFLFASTLPITMSSLAWAWACLYIFLSLLFMDLKQTLSKFALFGICIWGNSTWRPSHPVTQVFMYISYLAESYY